MNQLARQQQPSQCFPAPTSLSSRLQPVSAAVGESELLACLVLVAPSGMTADDRHAWIKVARETLKGIPEDLLQRGCKKARTTCTFASEIVPTIFKEVGATWERRKRQAAEDEAARNTPSLPRPTYDPIPREETQRIIREAMGGK